MKGKAAVVVLVLCCLGLGIAFFVRHSTAVDQQRRDEAKIVNLSNDLARTEGRLTEQTRVNASLETNLAVRTTELAEVSNRLVSVSSTLAQTEADATAAAKAARDQIASRDAKIAQLEGQNDELTRKMGDLNTALTDLEKQIAETERKLSASEGDREFLLGELKRLQGEKAELERQFNDLALLRDQVRKLKDELSISRRLEWIRRGLYGSAEQKGSEKLQPGFATPPGQGNVDLDVEIRQGGGARVVPPTNAPAETPKAP